MFKVKSLRSTNAIRLSVNSIPGIVGSAPLNCVLSTIHSLKVSTVTSSGSWVAEADGGTIRSTAESTKPIWASTHALSSSASALNTWPFNCVVPRTIFSQAIMFSGRSLPCALRFASPLAMAGAMRSSTTGPTAVVTRSTSAIRSTTSSPMLLTALTPETVSTCSFSPTT